MPQIHRIIGVRLYFLPVQTRMPLKFGAETLTGVTCARVALRVVDGQGNEAEGWGETPLSVAWAWPGLLPFQQREDALKSLCRRLAGEWLAFKRTGHALEIGYAFLEQVLPAALAAFNHDNQGIESTGLREPMPRLAALVCNSAFDIALHDAYGLLAGRPVYHTYGPDFLAADLARYLEPAERSAVSFHGRYPADFLLPLPPRQLPAWHLVGGLDPLEPDDLTGTEPKDGHPVILADWILRDGLKCVKIKLRGTDSAWDYERLVRVGRLALRYQVERLSADFNCTVHEPGYVSDILDRLKIEHPDIDAKLLYVEQPFAYDLEFHKLDVRSLSARKPLFLDESAHDWRMIRLGRELGWTGVALKTCKTQTGAVLSACWAKAHGMRLMVQDLTNPMLAQIAHVLLAAHVGTIMGVETNAMQFYPAASEPEARVHPGLYRRSAGTIDLGSIRGAGFGYRLGEIHRLLPEPSDLRFTT